MTASERRSHPKEATEPIGDGGPTEAASFIAQAVAELAAMARRHRLDTLGFLLDMAQLEAEEQVRLRLLRNTQ
ncbi:MAG TPA: hypothetical protein VGM35_02425 [Xanthobacteraceae bacterium]